MFGLKVIFLHRSVMLRALCMSLPSGFLGLGLAFVDTEGYTSLHENPTVSSMLWSSYCFILGFLIVLRNQSATTRFWHGADHFIMAQTSWLSVTSNLIAFCDRNPEQEQRVIKFRQMLVKMMSMLMNESLKEAMVHGKDANLSDLGGGGFDERSLRYLDSCTHRPTVLYQWVQHVIRDAKDENVITLGQPVLSRVYQELSAGFLAMTQAQQLREVPYPFPYMQLMTILLFTQAIITPSLAGLFYRPSAAFVISTGMMFVVWALHFIAIEIDQPFGSHANNLPAEKYSEEFNQRLKLLVAPELQELPTFTPQEKSLRIQPTKPRWSQMALEMPSSDCLLQCAEDISKLLSSREGVAELSDVRDSRETQSVAVFKSPEQTDRKTDRNVSQPDSEHFPIMGERNTALSSSPAHTRAENGLTNGHNDCSETRKTQQETKDVTIRGTVLGKSQKHEAALANGVSIRRPSATE